MLKYWKYNVFVDSNQSEIFLSFFGYEQKEGKLLHFLTKLSDNLTYEMYDPYMYNSLLLIITRSITEWHRFLESWHVIWWFTITNIGREYLM